MYTQLQASTDSCGAHMPVATSLQTQPHVYRHMYQHTQADMCTQMYTPARIDVHAHTNTYYTYTHADIDRIYTWTYKHVYMC